MTPRHLVLVGLSYSGKTTVGARAAELLGLPFVDTDAEIERRAGLSVSQVFARYGEPVFRALERQVVAEVVFRPPSVIATGGGAPLAPDNRSLLWEGNLVVYLKARPETVVARRSAAGDGETRPLLAGDEPLARVQALLDAREAIYQTAQLTVETDQRSPHDLARLVAEAYRCHAGD